MRKSNTLQYGDLCASVNMYVRVYVCEGICGRLTFASTQATVQQSRVSPAGTGLIALSPSYPPQSTGKEQGEGMERGTRDGHGVSGWYGLSNFEAL